MKERHINRRLRSGCGGHFQKPGGPAASAAVIVVIHFDAENEQVGLDCLLCMLV